MESQERDEKNKKEERNDDHIVAEENTRDSVTPVLDIKKKRYNLLIIICALCLGGAVLLIGGRISEQFGLWGYRVQSPITVMKYHSYRNDDSGIKFRYTDEYVIDIDAQNRYGDDYIAGIHLNADQRTGCDIRYNAVGINFAKTDQEISDAIYNDLGKNVKGLSEFHSKRIAIDREDAVQVDFLLVDPLGSTLHVTQVIASHDGQAYLIACGSGEAQYKFFSHDFQLLLDSFSWIK